MPSKGSPKVVIRLVDPLLPRILETIARLNKTTKKEPYTVTSWIVHCIRGELAHLDSAKMQKERLKVQRRAKRLHQQTV
jgi:hypothetical protein